MIEMCLGVIGAVIARPGPSAGCVIGRDRSHDRAVIGVIACVIAFAVISLPVIGGHGAIEGGVSTAFSTLGPVALVDPAFPCQSL